MESSGGIKDFFVIGFTFLLGMMLLALPLPDLISWLRPAWVFMILVFWLIAVPHKVGIFIAFIVGLLVDLLMGNLLGQHGLIFALTAYIIIKLHSQVNSFPLWQQVLMVLFLMLIYFSLQYWIMALAGVSSETWRYWLPILSTTILWPWVSMFLKAYQRRFKIR